MPQGMGFQSNAASFYPFMQGLEGGTPAASPSLFSVGAPGGTNWFDGMLGEPPLPHLLPGPVRRSAGQGLQVSLLRCLTSKR